MNWIEGYVKTSEGPRPVFVDSIGTRTVKDLRGINRKLKPQTTASTKYYKFDLRKLRPSSPRKYLEGVGFAPRASNGQAVYELKLGPDRVLVPASVLLAELVANLKYVGRHLLRLASLDVVAFQVPRESKIPIVRFSRTSMIPAIKVDEHLYQSTFLWLTGFPSARRMWASVLERANDGTLDFDLPAASVNASFTVVRGVDACFAVGMNIRELTPLESPYPNAIDLDGHTFEFRHYQDSKPADESLRLLAEPTTQKEWELLAPLLTAKVFDDAKASYDIALRKCVTGAEWATYGPKGKAASRVYQQVKKNGRWDVYWDAMLALREGRLCPMRTLPKTRHQARKKRRAASMK